MSKADSRWKTGVWVGKSDVTDEHIIAHSTGIHQARSVYRKPIEEQFSKALLDSACGTPWDAKQGAARDPPAQRRTYITQALVDKHGPTQGCGRCEGWSDAAHNQKCRDRFEKIFAAQALERNRAARVETWRPRCRLGRR